MTGREERSGTDEIPAEVLRRAVYTSPRASGSCPASPESEEGCMGKRSSGTSEERGKKLAFLEIGEILRSAFSRITTATAKPLKKDGSRAVAGALESVSKLFLNVPVWYIYGNWFRSFEEIREPLLKHFFEQHAAAEANDVALYYISNGCRSVALGADVLVRVLLTGIDVPRNNCFYSSDIVKAAEYGGFPKLVLLLDMKKFDRTFRRLPKTASDEEVAAVRQVFPYERDTGDKRYFSRLEDESHRFSSYEVNYARWIPGDPREALKGLLIIDNGFPADSTHDNLIKRLSEIVSGEVESDEIPFVRLKYDEEYAREVREAAEKRNGAPPKP